MSCGVTYERMQNPSVKRPEPPPQVACRREAGHDGSHYGLDGDLCAVWDSDMCLEADARTHHFWIPLPTAQEAFDAIYR